jgi:hypothetical protein
MKRDACFSEDGKHRLYLERVWGRSTSKTMFVIGLNPSKASAHMDDPTNRRAVGFAKREQCGRLVMLNVHTYCATDPDDLFRVPAAERNHHDAENQWIIHLVGAAFYGDIVVAAWGAEPRAREAINTFLAVARQFEIPLHCLGLTKDGSPRHPLYVRADAPLIPYPNERSQ